MMTFTQAGLFFRGRFPQASRMREAAERLAEAAGNLGAMLFCSRTRGFEELVTTGDLDRWEGFCAEDLARCKALGTGLIADSYTERGIGTFWRGDWKRALKDLREGATREPEGSIYGNSAIHELVRAYVGETGGAPWNFEALGSATPGRPNARTIWTHLLCAIEGMYILGRKTEAARLYPVVLDALRTGTAMRFYDFRLLSTLAGIGAAAAGRYGEAEQHYRDSLRLADELPSRIEAAEARRFYALMLLDRGGPGDRDEADRLLTEAIQGYRSLGMPRHETLAVESLKWADATP